MLELPNDLLPFLAQQKKLTACERIVFLHLMTATEKAYPSCAFIAQEVGCTRKHVSLCLKKLEAAGVIACVDTKTVQGGHVKSWSVRPALDALTNFEAFGA